MPKVLDQTSDFGPQTSEPLIMKRLVFTVTNDLTYDQRMIRICTSLATADYRVTLVGVRLGRSVPLIQQPFHQQRLYCFFQKGKFFYFEYNTRLFFYLLFKQMDGICAIDLDTILPCYWISRLKRITRIYDAHELFCEMKEVVTRPAIYRFWKRLERLTVPHFTRGYTVNQPIADEFRHMYHVNYSVIRNMPLLRPLTIPLKSERYILYQGAVNEGRSFETLIPAMKQVNARLYICGDGNFMQQARALAAEHQLGDKVIFTGKMPPDALREYTLHAWIGVTLFENTGLSNYYSLGNRFFDYLHAGLPQVCVNYPAYREINNQYPVAVLIDDVAPDTIAAALNTLLNDENRYNTYNTLQQHCLQARDRFNWQEEEKELLAFYTNID
jgi:glycosyltransferase involved in cell wall biosynthesis